MRAEYFPMYRSFTNKHFGSGLYIFNLFKNILSIMFCDIFSTKRRGHSIFTNVFVENLFLI